MKVVINYKNIRHNTIEFKKLLFQNVKICGVLKANAYGHGLIKTAKCISNQVDCYAVARLSEGLKLRSAKIDKPILVLGTIYDDKIDKAIINNLTLSISSYDDLKMLFDLATKHQRTIKVHIKCDSGMNRLGVKKTDEFEKMCIFLLGCNNIVLEGIYSHFATTLTDKAFMDNQFERFEKFMAIADKYFPKLIKHICNTAGVIADKKYHLDMVRIGLGLYGYLPNEDLRLNLLTAKSVDAKIVLVKDILKGESISYDRSFIANEDTKIAIVDVGYGDGFTKSFSLGRQVVTKYGNVPIVGKVCMDMLAINIGNFPLKIGDTINLLGENLKNYACLNDILHKCDTIIYEILCIFNKTR